MAIIHTFRDDSVLKFGAGRFDHWCVYLERTGQLLGALRRNREREDQHVTEGK